MTMHVNGIYNTQLVLMQMYCILHVFSIFDKFINLVVTIKIANCQQCLKYIIVLSFISIHTSNSESMFLI